MDKDQKIINFMGEWTPNEWRSFELKYRNAISKTNNLKEGLGIAVNYSRKVLKTHSTSFFIVTRFFFLRLSVALSDKRFFCVKERWLDYGI